MQIVKECSHPVPPVVEWLRAWGVARQPRSAQRFRMRDEDVIYVSDSGLVGLQRFINIIASSILPVATVRNIAR